MCRGHRNITVVGDDAQSIYSFRGASFRNILDFPRAVSRRDDRRRSSRTTARRSRSSTSTNTLISRALERFTKELWTHARRQRSRRGSSRRATSSSRRASSSTAFSSCTKTARRSREIAVLVRAGYMSADLEIELTNRKIPFEKWGGLKFLEAAHVKDVLAFLRVLENPRDEVSWYRILMLMPGHRRRHRARDDGVDGRARLGPGRVRALRAAGARARRAPRPRRRCSAACSTAQRGEGGVGEDIDEIRTLYDAVLAERYDRSEPRLADLDQLRVIAAGYPNRAAFLAALALEPPANTQDLAGGGESEDDALVISTVHSAKGKEWDAVFVIWAVDGWFPSSRSLDDEDELEEERRLMYVAMTRARNHLAVDVSAQRVRDAARRGLFDRSALAVHRPRRAREDAARRAAGADGRAGRRRDSGSSRTEPPLDLRALLRGRFAAG